MRRAVVATACVALWACTGGGGEGDNITVTTDNQGEDPVVLEIPVAYIKRPLPESPTDLRDPLAFTPGARLLVREQSATTAEEIDVTGAIADIVAAEEGVEAEQLALDIKDLESSFDGATLLFAVRAVPEPVDANLEFTTWNLWTLDLESMRPAYLIPSRVKRNEGMESGGGQDIAPHFLPDDRIVFSSTRQVASQGQLLNDGRGQLFAALDEDGDEPAAVLHVYDPQRRNAEFEQISFNLSHDLDPTVLADGEIAFSRWNNTATDHISLYRISPSGFGLAPLYGFHSQATGTEGAAIEFTAPRELDDGRLVSVAHNFAPDSLGGEIVIVDSAGHSDLNQALDGSEGGPGHHGLTETEVRSDGLRSDGGQFGSVYPLRDGTGRLLVTWSECRVIDEEAAAPPPGVAPSPGDYLPCTLQPDNTRLAPPLYGAWVYDPAADTQRPIALAEEGFVISEVVAAEPRDYPDLLPRPDDFNAQLALEQKGQLLIDSVYDVDGADMSPLGITAHARPGSEAYRQRPARFLRLVQPVPIPDRDVYEIPRYAFGVRGAGFREISGYVPVEPDGSVTVTVPADRPFSFDVLDVRGHRIGPSHAYWLQLRPGEVMHCRGCHARDSQQPHGRVDAGPPSANPGARALADGSTGFPGTDALELFATEPGQSMARVWDFHRPAENETATARELDLSQQYRDEWSAPGLEPDGEILDRDYDPAWTDIPPELSIVTASLDPQLPARIVINYPDHIQPIWERLRDPVLDAGGVPVDRCTGCHQSSDDSAVPTGQLDLTAVPSDVEPDHYRSYRELLSGDAEQWLDSGGALADRQRICTTTDADGNVLTEAVTVGIGASMRAGSAAASDRFFGCFQGEACGPESAPPLPDNCTEDGTPVEATRNTVDHTGMLSAAELRLIAEWLDIGAQYFNNPFDPRLAED